jgi:hypothetical protein
MSGLTGAAGGKAGTSANKKALAKLEADAEMLSALLDQLTGANQFATTLSPEAAMRRAEMATPQTVTVNFNGVVGDGESVKRSLVELFNDSEARGTLGATSFAGL